ncbi:hypothetical protein [Mycobacterium sp. E1747]|uniref:hypothetical protein n=1 Tax=Mycobacterium sp. E1747 TaxID=1834128 RepID=UPI000800533C|nr:hypothetical protein [Mycobacterium sp. E1747]OBH06140.1 hypothetical protein A5695_05735 [Mycobacterium sp. E1747]
MAVSGQVTGGHWAALLIGVVLLFTFLATTAAGLMRVHRGRRIETTPPSTDGPPDPLPSTMGASLWRCQAMIAEAVIVRQRLSGQIDAETYRFRMNALALQFNSERSPQRNA